MATSKYQAIFWDFDGVLMDSNSVRTLGFREVLSPYPESEVDQLIEFHERNGGLSRYVKFRHFFEQIRKEEVTEKEIDSWAEKFSAIMLNYLVDPGLLIDETLNFVKKQASELPMHIVSGSDQTELRFICKQMEIDQYFVSIHGSPTPKVDLVRELLEKHSYTSADCVLVGDSINDHHAASENGLKFMAYNNDGLKHLSNASIFFETKNS